MKRGIDNNEERLKRLEENVDFLLKHVEGLEKEVRRLRSQVNPGGAERMG